MLAVFGFVTFLFYKICSAFLYEHSLSVLYCFVMMIVTVGVVVVVGFLFQRWVVELASVSKVKNVHRDVREDFLLFAFGPPILVSVAINALLGYLVAYGFSEAFADRYLDYYTGNSRYHDNSDFWLFLAVLTPPPLLFFGLQALNVHLQLPKD